MTDSPDQHLIDELVRKLNGDEKPSTNGNGANYKASESFRTDEQIIEKCRKAKNAAKFSSLFDDGYTGDHDDDDSRADLALLGIIAFYTQDPQQLDSLFRKSALYRPKWNRKTYREPTIKTALSDLSEIYSWGDGATIKVPRPQPRPQESHADTSSRNSAIRPDSRVSRLAESILLPFRSAKTICEEEPAETDWLAFPWIAMGSITELAGPIKRSGKTTFLTCLARKVLDGEVFMGGHTKKTAVVYLTEQSATSFRRALKTAKLEDREDFHVLYWHDTRGVAWPKVVELATEYAQEVGAAWLVVDVISRWAGLEGDAENSSGAALEAMRPLKEAAGKGLAVTYARHDRKGGGAVGESGRGSSQFGGDVDQMLQLKRSDGNARPTVRVLEAIGRFDETPASVNIDFDLEAGEYTRLGDSHAVEEQMAMKTVIEVLPTKAENAISTEEVIDRAAKFGCKKTMVKNVLSVLAEAETMGRAGKGKKGSPYMYWKPLPDDPAEDEIHSARPPTLDTGRMAETDNNESGGDELKAPSGPQYCKHSASIGSRCVFCEEGREPGELKYVPGDDDGYIA